MTNSADSGVLENPNRRVKVYVLGIDGQWDDRGTGYVSCELLPVSMPRCPSVENHALLSKYVFRDSSLVSCDQELCREAERDLHITRRNSIL